MEQNINMGLTIKSKMNTTYKSKKPFMMIEEPQQSNTFGIDRANSFMFTSPEISEDQQSHEEIPQPNYQNPTWYRMVDGIKKERYKSPCPRLTRKNLQSTLFNLKDPS